LVTNERPVSLASDCHATLTDTHLGKKKKKIGEKKGR